MQLNSSRLVEEELENMDKPPPPTLMKVILEPEPEDKKNSSRGFEELPKKSNKVGAVIPISILDQEDGGGVDEDGVQAPLRRTSKKPELNHTSSLETESIIDDTDGRYFRVHNKDVHFAKFSLGIFSNKNAMRRRLVWLITWKYFEFFITAMIIANSILLGMMDYTDKENKGWRNRLV